MRAHAPEHGLYTGDAFYWKTLKVITLGTSMFWPESPQKSKRGEPMKR